MEELDLLKKHWNKEENFPKVDKASLSKMLHKNSSSIVKWILIICLAEFLLGLSLKSYYIFGENQQMKNYEIIIEIASTLITGSFLFLFLREYYRIKTFSNAKSLMNSILNTRNWVKKYIILTLGLIFIQLLLGSNDFILGFKEGYHGAENANHYISDTVAYTVVLLTFSIVIIILLLYYRFVYIRLIKKLQKNYEELIDLEK